MAVARDPFDGDEGFERLVLTALDHATSCLAGDEGPLLPFAMIVDEGERVVRHFVSKGYEQTLDGALAFAGHGDYEFWAVAWDGYMTVEGRRTEAVFVRAGAEDHADSVLFALRYERPPPSRRLERIGDPVYLGSETEPLGR
jgi:hypothetical protein